MKHINHNKNQQKIEFHLINYLLQNIKKDYLLVFH